MSVRPEGPEESEGEGSLTAPPWSRQDGGGHLSRTEVPLGSSPVSAGIPSLFTGLPGFISDSRSHCPIPSTIGSVLTLLYGLGRPPTQRPTHTHTSPEKVFLPDGSRVCLLLWDHFRAGSRVEVTLPGVLSRGRVGEGTVGDEPRTSVRFPLRSFSSRPLCPSSPLLTLDE